MIVSYQFIGAHYVFPVKNAHGSLPGYISN